MPGAADEYVLARRVLLDALETLGTHREAIVLVGAQALYLYLHTGHVEFAVAPYTTDADLAVNPETLADAPLLAAVMERGGFTADIEPGTWWKNSVQVDLMVPEALAGSGRRGARLGVHGNKVTRKARGLEAALVDYQPMKISALANDDPRSFEIAVASPAALLVAKVHKIQDRIAAPNRLTDKDALDVYRLLFAVDSKSIVLGIRKLRQDDLSRAVTAAALSGMQQLFGATSSVGMALASRAAGTLIKSDTLTASFATLVGELFAAGIDDDG
jgi:hypothetical protein